MGNDCRYKGDNCKNEKILSLNGKHVLIPVCPEVMGGLPTPRDPSEKVGDRIINSAGKDVTAEYAAGAQKTLQIAKETSAELCIFKAKSPSCGHGKIYDGTFSGRLIDGNGVTAELLERNGYKVITEADEDELALLL